ncbi:MAG: C40 family peptidase [Peptoniphilus sp.]|nr:C40 family peptidase [Peptoniphilus sp.]MDD7363117.1 C40 family peptidase [Bacillota bacterium]MDY6044361.1 C40 family peptidase [Peptoniphilus sp.]
MNHKIKLTIGTAALALISVVGLRDTGVFVQDHNTTLYSGKKLSFAIEEKANIVDSTDNGYIIQKGNAKVTVPKQKVLVTEGKPQHYVVKKNAILRRNGKVVRNLFVGETLDSVKHYKNGVAVNTADGLYGSVEYGYIEAVPGPYVTSAKVKQDLKLENANGVYNLKKDQPVKVVSYQGGLFIIVDDNGKDFQIDPNYLDFGEGGVQAAKREVVQQQAPQANNKPAAAPSTDAAAPKVDGAKAQRVINSAYNKLGTPYVWGGTSAKGYDCSGLVYAVYVNELGISLPRTSSAQSKVGTQVSRSNLQPGDLLFFNTVGSGVSHVGIYIGNDVFIHASSGSAKVRESKLSEKYYSTRFVNATRVL